MFAQSIISKVVLGGTRHLSPALLTSCQPTIITNCLQVRLASKKTKQIDYAYGIKPILSDDEYLKAKEEDRLEDLQYQQVRFAILSENNSLLYDKEYEKFVNLALRGGRKGEMYDLMDKTFFYIKKFQLSKLRKRIAQKEEQEEQQHQQQDSTATTTKKKKNQATINEGEEEEVIETDPMKIFKTALKNCQPVVITKSVKRGGAIYQVPYPITQAHSEWFAAKWLISAVKDRPKPKVKHYPECMAQELIDAFYNRGKVVKKKDDIHKLANANKAYAHYRWG